MQLSLRNRLSNTRNATNVIVNNDNLREALKNRLNNDLVVAKYYNNDDAKKESCKNQIVCKEQ